MRSLAFASFPLTCVLASAAALVACNAAVTKPAADAKPAAAAASPTPKPELTGMPDWRSGDGDLAAAAAAMADDEDIAKFRTEHADAAGKPAERVYKNVMVLDGMTTDRFIAAMHGMHESLGVRCPFCHDPQNFSSDEKNEKKAARNMLFVAQRINVEHFDAKTRVTCWTCHRGKEKPEKPAADFMKKAAAVPLPGGLPTPPADPKTTAGTFYKNLHRLGSLPANQIVPIMQAISLSLGKSCDFCHDTTDFSADTKKEKAVARDMMQLNSRANAEIFGTMEDEDAIGCWTCHRGQVKPERTPGSSEMPH